MAVDLKITNISKENICDINRLNQEFEVFGRLIPLFTNGKWDYDEKIHDKSYMHCFPNDESNYSEYIDNPDKTVIFAYVDFECVGQIRIRKNWNRYCFVEDIAVSKDYRKQGIASKLLYEAEVWAKGKSLFGFMLEAQDYNLGACRFYIKNGFVLGSVDNMLYYNTEDRGALALFWYKVF